MEIPRRLALQDKYQPHKGKQEKKKPSTFPHIGSCHIKSTPPLAQSNLHGNFKDKSGAALSSPIFKEARRRKC